MGPNDGGRSTPVEKFLEGQDVGPQGIKIRSRGNSASFYLLRMILFLNYSVVKDILYDIVLSYRQSPK